jgi:broad specificity phosphatase PhoE
MPEIFEVRRHSLRGEGDALSPEGLELARRAAPTLLGNCHAAYTSPRQRCIETLRAFGFTTYKIIPQFGTLPSTLAVHDAKLQALRTRTGCTLLEAYFAFPATHLILQEFGKAFLERLCGLAAELPAGKNALAVSHGGSIEPAVLAAMPDWTLEDLGGEIRECEAALFRFDGGMLRGVELRRL